MDFYEIQLNCEKGVVTMRTKPDLNPTTPWSPAEQFFPPPSTPGQTPVDPDIAPSAAPLKEWPSFDKVQRHLTNFYTGAMKATVTHVPDDVRDGNCYTSASFSLPLARTLLLLALAFALAPALTLAVAVTLDLALAVVLLPNRALAPTLPQVLALITLTLVVLCPGMLEFLDGVQNAVPTTPEWIRWADNPHRIVPPQVDDSDDDTPPDRDETDDSSASGWGEVDDESEDDKDDETDDGDLPPLVPASQPAATATAAISSHRDGRMCRCGSQQHYTVAHKRCPLNKSGDVLELFPGDEHRRLLRYVPRTYLYRYTRLSLFVTFSLLSVYMFSLSLSLSLSLTHTHTHTPRVMTQVLRLRRRKHPQVLRFCDRRHFGV